MARTKTKNARLEHKRIKIIEVATRLFSEHGYHETKLEEVAKEADVAKGTLYLYFKNKEDLLLQCLLDGFEKDMATSQAIIDNKAESIEHRLEKLLEVQFEISKRNGPLIRKTFEGGQIFSKNSGAPKKFVEMLNAKVEQIAEFFAEGVGAGAFSDRLNPIQMALIFHQIFNLNLNFQMFNQPDLSIEHCRDILFDLFAANASSPIMRSKENATR